MVYIVFEKRVVADSSGKAREFGSRKSAKAFIFNRFMPGAEIVSDISGISKRCRTNQIQKRR
jgi:hypothetical protein